MYPTRRLPVFLISVAVAACAGQHHPLTATTADGLRGRRIAGTVRPRAPFSVSVPGKHQLNMYGLVGAVAIEASMSDAGALIVRENGIADPAPTMARRLNDDLQRRYGLKLDRQSIYIVNEDPKSIAAAHPEIDLLLDVWIDRLGLEPFDYGSAESSKYHITYTAHLRLLDEKVLHPIDGKKGLVIARGTCVHTPKETPDSPTYDEFLADGARRLKDALDLATKSCADEFRSQVLIPEDSPGSEEEGEMEP